MNFPKLSIANNSGSGLAIRAAVPADALDCVEFRLRADTPQDILIAPWIQFEPIALAEFRQKMAYEIARRAEVHDTLVETISTLQKTIERQNQVMDRRAETQETTYRLWREDRAALGKPDDFSDVKDWPPEMMSGYEYPRIPNDS